MSTARQNTETISSWHLSEFDKPLFVASCFGFNPIKTPKVTDKDVEITNDCDNHPHYNAAEKAAFLRTYVERDLASTPHPLAFSYKLAGSSKKSTRYALEMVGYAAGIAEALLIRACLSMLLESGYKDLVVDINCVGDKESLNAYENELHNFLRRTGANLSPDTKKELKRDVFNLIKMESDEIAPLKERMPASIAFLSSQSRLYFKEVLEHIESLDIEFRLAPHLIGDRSYCSHTIFAIKNISGDKEETVAVGYCYPRLSKRLGFKKEPQLAGANLFIEKTIPTAAKPQTVGRIYKHPKPKFYLIQLGREAKMRSLSVIEMLRREKIPVSHVIGKDKIAPQLTHAENLGLPYLIIIGHKEALDNTATVRNVITRAQDTIPLQSLPLFLKNIAL
jgi:histidyl-tRNA synthetase